MEEGKEADPSMIEIIEHLKGFKQKEEETLSNFSSRIWMAIIENYPENTADEIIDIVSKDTFLDGCLEQTVVQQVRKKKPDNMVVARFYMEKEIEEQKVIGYKTDREQKEDDMKQRQRAISLSEKW